MVIFILLFFNFIHYVELIMEDSITYFKLNREKISSEELRYKDSEHRLFSLWNSLRNYLDNDNEVGRICK